MMRNVQPWIFTVSGARFFFANPADVSINISDIAASLSKLCRFTGHTRKFYSVAEHAVNASRIVSQRFAFEALMHDAHEAYIGDVSSPLKAEVGSEYRRVDHIAHAAIARKYDLPYIQSQEVTAADLAMLKHEATWLLPNCDVSDFNLPDDLPTVKIKLECLPPHRAEALFLRRYRELAAL